MYETGANKAESQVEDDDDGKRDPTTKKGKEKEKSKFCFYHGHEGTIAGC